MIKTIGEIFPAQSSEKGTWASEGQLQPQNVQGEPTEDNSENMSRTEALAAIETLIEHAGETFPHFESPRGVEDIARAVEAAKVLAS